MANTTQNRLLTRGDLDGLVCAVLIKYLGIIDEIKLIDHPNTMQERGVVVSERDITTNLPYVPGVGLAIDHHISEKMRNAKNPRHIIDPEAPSAARVVYNYFGGRKRFPKFFDEMMDAVDKADSGRFTIDEVLHPKGWPLLNFLVDQRTGIEEWGSFKTTEEQFKLDLIDSCMRMKIDAILNLPDVKERAAVYFRYEKQHKDLLTSLAEVYRSIVVVDIRKMERVYPGNRFMVYALYPECNLSILIRIDKKNGKTVFSVGKSIINRTAAVNVGEIMLSYGGGGHRAAGACHVASATANEVLDQLIEKLSNSHQASLSQ